MPETAIRTQGGMGFTSALQIVFVVLKLADVIDWSWWWVLSPLWGGAAIAALVFAAAIAVAVLTSRRKRR